MPLTRESSHLVELIYVLNEAKSQARERKRRVRQRLAALQRDTPIRGPWKPQHPGMRWTFYRRALENHQAATRRVTALAWSIQRLLQTRQLKP